MTLIAGALLTGLVANQAVAAQSAHAASVVPDGLFTDLVNLDRKLAKLIDEERTNGLSTHNLSRHVDQIERAKLAMVDQFFAQPTYGVKFSEVFRKLDCLDQALKFGIGVKVGAGASLGAFDERLITASFEDGKACKQKLENELAAGAPPALLTDLIKLDHKLGKLIDEERTNGLSTHDLSRHVDQIERAKLAMVDQFFAQPTYGVKFSEVFRKLDCLDQALKFGIGVKVGAGASLGAFDERLITASFEDGKACKQKLEAELHKANAESQCTGHAMLGNIYGGQAHELVADFTCPKPSTEFSLTVPSGYQISGGQASNAASSGGYSCNLNSTNTTVDCTGAAPAGSTTYVQMTTSPDPQAGMKLPLKVSFSDSSTTSFTLTSR